MRRIVPLLLCLFLASCVTTSRNLDVAPEGTQSIVMWHKPSGESINVTYRIGGHYVPEAFAQIDHLFRDRRTGEETGMDPALIDVIADMRDKMIMPADTPIELTSGYRSPESNAFLAKYNKHVAKGSYHTKGQAADIRIPDMNSRVLELVAMTMQRGGVALYPDSGHVHVDVGPVRGWAVKPGREDGTANEGPTQENGAAAKVRRKPAAPAHVASTNLKTRKKPMRPPAQVMPEQVMKVPLAPRDGAKPVITKTAPAAKKPAVKAAPAAKAAPKAGKGTTAPAKKTGKTTAKTTKKPVAPPKNQGKLKKD